MATSRDRTLEVPVIFAGLGKDEARPRFAVYRVDKRGRPSERIGSFDGKHLKIDLGGAETIAFGPDTDDPGALAQESLTIYRVAQKLETWRRQGVVIAQDAWHYFIRLPVCVAGKVRKCRPWFWDYLQQPRLAAIFDHLQRARVEPLGAELQPQLRFPVHCMPLCDGVVEVFERSCCCPAFDLERLLRELQRLLEGLPVPVPAPIPDPGSRLPRIPDPDESPFSDRVLRETARRIGRGKAAMPALAAIPSQKLYQDYLAMRRLAGDAALRYVGERPYLWPLCCPCSLKKVGQTTLQPGGHFDFCYWRRLSRGTCRVTHAFRVRQRINGTWVVVYDGVAAHDHFPAGESADLSSFDPRAVVCADGPGDAPPNEGVPFVMLEHVGRYGSFHFNFPQQADVARMAALDHDDGTYATGYAPDCPWGGRLGLRLWFSPELDGTVAYYRLKVVPVDDDGMAAGTPIVLDDSVAWDKFVESGGEFVRVPEVLGPVPVASGEPGLFRVPYWSSPEHRYLSGQYHQIWDTARDEFGDRRFMLAIEVFDDAGSRIRPDGASGPGADRNFQFRRWTSTALTAVVPFADAAHVFWVDNTPVGGDLVDLRVDGVANGDQCQFLSGTADSRLSVGFRAYHVHGVDHSGTDTDADSFMMNYDLRWLRGLNGGSGALAAAPSTGNDHTDVGENGPAVESGSADFSSMLDLHGRCTFTVRLRVRAKHFDGRSRISAYDFAEIASFALQIGGS
ncbi:MAG: hypothetical protein KDH15_12455 [Rhodocyclaceae bacterium]|nr:hypothetical protein [Rhodocyclaceae bacterium]